jgi:hypothetical protein
MDRLLEDVARMKRVTQSLMDPGDKAVAITQAMFVDIG